MTDALDPRPVLTGNQSFITSEIAHKLLPTRSFGAHKWGVGGLVIVAGSPSYSGAALLSARSAGRAGAGIVQLAAGRGVIATIASGIPEVAHIPLPETDAPGAAKRVVEQLSEHLEKAKAILIGPGLGRDNAAKELLSAIFALGNRRDIERRNIGFSPLHIEEPAEPTKSTSPLFANEDLKIVVDADALDWLSEQTNWWEYLPEHRLVLTPHLGEFSKLTGKTTDEVIANPIAELEAAAKLWKQTVVLKYGYTAVSDGTRTVVADDAPVSLATAGSGDVLAGMIAALLAQGVGDVDAVAVALHVGPAAARRIEQRFGVAGLIATDLPDAIAEEIHALSVAYADVADH